MSKEIVIYTSPTCGPCKQLKPALEAQAASRGFPLRIVEASFETQEEFITAGVRVVPTVIVLADGKEAGRFTGARTPAQLEEQLVNWGL